VNQFINVYEKLFNVIFDNGIMPSSWLIGMIKPIYKNKGDKFDPKSYIFPFILFSNILCHKPARQTVSKAFIKSTNAQYIFFFLHLRISKKDCKVNENLFPFLFSLFLNDLETFLEAKNVTGFESISGDLENQLNIYLQTNLICTY
jgi:hypothetical protein